jgi:autotransporter-associated beta strand protein
MTLAVRFGEWLIIRFPLSNFPLPLMFLKYREAQFPQFIVITLCALSGTHLAHAASATWNGATSSSWSASTNWSASPGPGTGNTATFDNSTAGAAQTIITGSITIASILFNTSSAAAYTLGGASAGMGQITLNDGGSIAVNSSITRSQTVNANLVLGTNAGTSSYSLTNNSTSAGQLLNFAGTIGSGQRSKGSNPKILVLGGIGDGLISGVISGNGSGSGSSETAQVDVTKIGHGTWTFSGVNTYTGLTDIRAGTLAYGVNNALANGAVQVSGGTLDLRTFSDTIGAVTLASGSIMGSTGVLTGSSYALQSGEIGVILGGAGALNKTTSGTVILSGANTYTGLITVTGGILRATTKANALGTSGATLKLAGGILELANDTGLNFARNTTLTADSSIVSDVGSFGCAGVTHTLGTLAITGQTLSIGVGANVGSAIAGITFGAVAVNGAAVTTTFNVASGALLTLGAITPASGGSKVIAFGGDGDATVNGVIYDAAGGSTVSVTKSGIGVLILSSANLYEGSTTLSAGVIRVKNKTALGTTSAGTTVADGAALEIDGTAGNLTNIADALTLKGAGISSGGALRNVAGNNTYTGAVTLGSASRINSDSGILTINSTGSLTGNFGLTFGGAGSIILSDAFAPVSTAQTLTKDGVGKLTLNAASSHTGLTTVGSGTLEYGVSNALCSGGLTVSGGTLDLKTFSDTVGAVVLSSGNITGTTGVLTGKSYDVRSGSITANLAGGGALTKSTAGTVILVGSNTYSGGTQLGEGVLALGSAGALGSTGSIGFGSGTLQFSSNNITDYSNRFSTAAGQVYRFDTNGRNVTFSTGLVSSGGTLTKVGTGSLTISGISTYSGKTIVSGGTLAIGASGSIANTAEVSLDGGNLNVAAKANASLGSGQSLTGSGSVTGDLTIHGTLGIGSLLGTIAFDHNLALQSGSISNFDFSSGGFGIGTYDLAKGGLSKTVSFGGTLNLFFKAGETFSHDTSVKIFDFGHYEGAFSAVNVTGLASDHTAIFDSRTGIVTVVPEPKAALMVGLGILILCIRRR